MSEWVEDADDLHRYWGGNYTIEYIDQIIAYWSWKPDPTRLTTSGPGAHVGFRCARTVR